MIKSVKGLRSERSEQEETESLETSGKIAGWSFKFNRMKIRNGGDAYSISVHQSATKETTVTASQLSSSLDHDLGLSTATVRATTTSEVSGCRQVGDNCGRRAREEGDGRRETVASGREMSAKLNDLGF
ncbi:hypothetical protein ACLOJK_031447 [Asimina triloba]